jgi:hypothetical protein
MRHAAGSPSQWGDASLWYLIADANGLAGNAALAAGTTLTIPAKVTNVHNNAATFTVYDPSKAVGNILPVTAPPASHGGGCGVFGEILEVIVAVAVTVRSDGDPIIGDAAKGGSAPLYVSAT